VPELPDIVVYLEALAPRVVGQALVRFRLPSPFVLRSIAPPPEVLEGVHVTGLQRIGKRIVLVFEQERYLVIHLMVAGRLRWLTGGTKPPARITLAMLEFAHGTLALTEAGSKRRASLNVVAGAAPLAALDPGGIDPLGSDLVAFTERLLNPNATLKRALTDPHRLSGIGNAYSDEILHRAQLSPLKLTQQLPPAEIARLHVAVHDVLREWTQRLRLETGDRFPDKVTAFRPQMAVHGRYGQPCPVCAAPVQRIVHAENEINYCARCQTGGRILADRAMSQLLHDSFPRRIEDLE
jgi:formamidopyrimidine-DNA glycosylase